MRQKAPSSYKGNSASTIFCTQQARSAKRQPLCWPANDDADHNFCQPLFHKSANVPLLADDRRDSGALDPNCFTSGSSKHRAAMPSYSLLCQRRKVWGHILCGPYTRFTHTVPRNSAKASVPPWSVPLVWGRCKLALPEMAGIRSRDIFCRFQMIWHTPIITGLP